MRNKEAKLLRTVDLSQFDDLTQNLAILAEECGEVTQVIGKILRFGLESTYPNDPTTNRQRLASEIGDLVAMVDILIVNGIIENQDMIEAIARKKEKLTEWYMK